MSTSAPILQIFNESDEQIPFSLEEAQSLLRSIAAEENAGFEMVEVVYVNEKEIVEVNKEHLDRDYVTDIISFRYDDGQENGLNTEIEGTLYCCAPRIIEQASEFDETLRSEFLRIFIHGILHLIGYEDSTPDEKKIMTDLENKYLTLAGANN